jgi:hypothetical protein
VITAGKEKQMKRKALTTAGLCAIAVALAQAGLRPAAAHANHRATQATTVSVTTRNSDFRLSANSAPRGVVIFKIHNTAGFHHDFSINGRTSKVLTHGQSTTLRVTFLRKGRYPWKCALLHHAGWGEKGVFTIY